MGVAIDEAGRDQLFHSTWGSKLSLTPQDGEGEEKEMIAKYNELMVIWSQKDKTVLRSVDEDNRLIAEADVVRLDALNAVRATLNL